MTADTAEREAFEKWLSAQCHPSTRVLWAERRGESYAHPVSRGAWEAWQARASAPAGAPEGLSEEFQLFRARLTEWLNDFLTDQGAVDWLGHVSPALERVSAMLSAAPPPPADIDFVSGLQGFASMCESEARSGGMGPDDCNMVAAKLRDVAFVVDQLQKLRDGKISCGWELRPALEPAPAQVEGEPCPACKDTGSEADWVGDGEDDWTLEEKLGCVAWDAAMNADARGDDTEAKYISVAKAVVAALEGAKMGEIERLTKERDERNALAIKRAAEKAAAETERDALKAEVARLQSRDAILIGIMANVPNRLILTATGVQDALPPHDTIWRDTCVFGLAEVLLRARASIKSGDEG